MSTRFPVNMLDLIWKCFGYGQLWPLWPTCSQIQFCTLEEQNQIKCGKLDLVNMIISILCKTGSDLDGLVRFWPNASGPEASWCAGIIGLGSGRMQLACYLFAIFRLCCNLPQIAQITLCKTSLDLIWFWLTVSGFGQMDLAWKQADVQE